MGRKPMTFPPEVEKIIREVYPTKGAYKVMERVEKELGLRLRSAQVYDMASARGITREGGRPPGYDDGDRSKLQREHAIRVRDETHAMIMMMPVASRLEEEDA